MKLILRPEYRRMLLSLDPSEGQIVTRSMRRIERAPEAIGKPLRGGLSMCRSIRTGHNSRLRIVYRPSDDDAELIAVGRREGRVVYIVALEILEN